MRANAWFQLSITQRLRLWGLMALLVAVAAAYLVLRPQPILQTNLLALLPQTERNPVAEQAIAQLATVTQNRAVFLVGAPDTEQATAKAKQFAQSLRASGAFSNVTLEVNASSLGAMQSWIRDHRFLHMDERDRHSLEAADSPDVWLSLRLQARLISPFTGPQSLDFAADPMGLAQSWFDSLPFRSVKLAPEGDVLVAHEAGQTWVFVHATLNGTAYDHSAAQQAIQSVAQAKEVSNADPLLRAGTVFHAESARRKAQADVDLIGAGSIIGLLLLLYGVFRSFRPFVGSMISVLFGIFAASVVCVAVYAELHLITLVFGISLIGEAVDYAIQYFAAHLDAGERWQPLAELSRMKGGLCIALATSLLGYGALWLSPFMALSQIALFAMVGLSAAWISVFLFLPWWMLKPTLQEFGHRGEFQRRWLAAWQQNMSARASLVLALAVLVISSTGWVQIEGHDDVRQLMATDAELSQQEAHLKALTGIDTSSQFFLVEGKTPEEVLQREERLRRALTASITAGHLTGYQAVSLFVPSQARQEEALQAWEQHIFWPPQRLPHALDQAGAQPQIAPDLRTQLAQQRQSRLHVNDWLSNSVSAPWRQLWLGQTAHGYASVVLPLGLKPHVSLQPVAAQVPSVLWVDKAGGVSQLFANYRQYSALWLALALVLVLGLLVWRYGVRNGAAVLLPTVLAIAFSVGAYSWFGRPMTLFNMMALMLVLGIGVNYAIFLVEGGARSVITFVGVQLSAATTLLSFGLLAFSTMPVLSGFGLSLTLGITCAVLLSPMALSLAKKAQ